MRVAIDTNILVYVEGVNGTERTVQAQRVFASHANDSLIIPVQVLGELFNVLTRKGGRSRASAEHSIREWSEGYEVVSTSPNILIAATGLSAGHQLSIWDAVILSAASFAGCAVLLSEDMQHGFTWRGVTVRNPFVP